MEATTQTANEKAAQMMPYLLMALAIIATGIGLKHLMQWDAWEAFMIVALKDAATIIFVIHFSRFYRQESESIQKVAMKALFAILTVSVLSDWAIVWMRN